MILRLPALLIGIVLAAYWGRVLCMSYKARKRIGQGANLIPPERLGRALRLIWAPAVLLWICQPWLFGLMHAPPRIFAPLYVHPPLMWLCGAIVAIGFAFTWICWKKMGSLRLAITGKWMRKPVERIRKSGWPMRCEFW